MSYESYLRTTDVSDLTQDSVDYYVGDRRDFLKRHDEVSAAAVQTGRSGVREASPYLLDRIADPRMLRIAWDHLRSAGGDAPGANGHRFDDYDDAEVWSLLRAIGKAIRCGTYLPGKCRTRQVPKASGHGSRPLVITNVEDRVIERAIYRTLRPLLDPLFDDRSFGSRPRRDRRHALALAEHLTFVERRRVWIVEDIQKAFENVPRSQLMDVLRRYLPDDDLLRLIEIVIDNGQKRGLKQGGPVSPLLMNLYGHHFLDTKWRKRHPDIPLVRIVDDLLVLCRSLKESRLAYRSLHELLGPAGLPRKHGYDAARGHLGRRDSADWVGYEITKRTKALAVRVGESAWSRLAEKLGLCHQKPHPPLRARRTILGWYAQLGPCWDWQDRAATYDRVATIAEDLAFEEIPAVDEIENVWREAHEWWCAVRSQVRVQNTIAP